MSADGKDLINKLLMKDPKKRVNIKDVLDHKWITEQDQGIKELRRKSQDMNDAVLQFVAYSNVNVEKVKENSPRAADRAGFQVGSLKDQANLGGSNFMQQMKAKQAGGGQMGGSSGLFGKGANQGNQ